MRIYTVSFFGHRRMDDWIAIEKRLEQRIRMLLSENEYIEFLVGRDGEFDQLVSSAVRRCKRTFRNDNSSLVCVLPYQTAEFRDNEESFRDYYDEIEVCADATAGYFKTAHRTRNQAMVDRSDFVIFCVEHESGGAWQAMKYAKKQGIPYINIAEEVSE